MAVDRDVGLISTLVRMRSTLSADVGVGHAGARIGLLLACLVLPWGSAAQAAPAPGATADVLAERVIRGEKLMLVSVPSAEMSSMRAGSTANWDVGVTVMGPAAIGSSVTVYLDVVMATPGAFSASVQRCNVRWTETGCPSGAGLPIATPITTGASTAVETATGAVMPWYRIAVTMITPDVRAVANLRFLAVGVGEIVSSDTAPGSLPATGAQPTTPLVSAALAVTTGLILAAVAHRRRPCPTPKAGV